ncbi:MAG: hypothetical protein ACTSU5_01020 [Promethearchaeota archaeon]
MYEKYRNKVEQKRREEELKRAEKLKREAQREAIIKEKKVLSEEALERFLNSIFNAGFVRTSEFEGDPSLGAHEGLPARAEEGVKEAGFVPLGPSYLASQSRLEELRGGVLRYLEDTFEGAGGVETVDLLPRRVLEGAFPGLDEVEHREFRGELVKYLEGEFPREVLLGAGISGFVRNGEFHVLKKRGLHVFLEAAVDAGIDVDRFLENFEDYLNYGTRIVKKIAQTGRPLTKEEVWELDVPISAIDHVMGLVNLDIDPGSVTRLLRGEVEHFNALTARISPLFSTPERVGVQDLIAEYDLDFVDASVVVALVRYIAGSGRGTAEVYAELGLGAMYGPEALDGLATRVVASIQRDGPGDLLRLAANLGTGLMDAVAGYQFYRETIAAPSEVTPEFFAEASLTSLFRLDDLSLQVMKYLAEVNPGATIEEMILALDLGVAELKRTTDFTNHVLAHPDLDFDYGRLPEQHLEGVDALACWLLEHQPELETGDGRVSFNALCLRAGKGALSVRLALGYYDHVEALLSALDFDGLGRDTREVYDESLSKSCAHVDEEGADLSVDALVRDLGYSYRDSALLVTYYNWLVSRPRDYEKWGGESAVEGLARQVFRVSKDRGFAGYPPLKVFSARAELGTPPPPLEFVWVATRFLKERILAEATSDERVATTAGAMDVAVEDSEAASLNLASTLAEISTAEASLGGSQPRKFTMRKSTENVTVKRGIDYVGGLIRYKVVVRNESPLIISNVEVKLRMQADHIRVVSLHPEVYRREDHAVIPNMAPGQSISVDFHLEPLICGVIPVHPNVVYTDPTGQDHMVSREAVDVNSKCPLIVNPGETNVARVRKLFGSPEFARNFVSFHLDHPPGEVFEAFTSGIQGWTGQPVSPPVVIQESPLVEEVFYYVQSQNANAKIGKEERIIVRLYLEEARKSVLLHVAAETNPTVTGVLIHLRGLVNSELVHHFGAKLASLTCPICGGPIEDYRGEGGTVTCSYCKGTLQLEF